MIQAETISRVKDLLIEKGVDETTVTSLRGHFPDVHFTYCSEDDIHGGKPVEETDEFSIYLVDSREHCLTLTQSPEIATGMVIAERYDDE